MLTAAPAVPSTSGEAPGDAEGGGEQNVEAFAEGRAGPHCPSGPRP